MRHRAGKTNGNADGLSRQAWEEGDADFTTLQDGVGGSVVNSFPSEPTTTPSNKQTPAVEELVAATPNKEKANQHLSADWPDEIKMKD